MLKRKSRIISKNGKFYDTGTKNKSFIQVAKDLRSLGVQNWYFMLEIKDPTLINVDPYAEDGNGHTTLTKDQISRINLECLNNMWYYLREIARIPAAGNPRGIPYKANRGNIAQAWTLLNGIDSWLCLPRQQGKTKSALAAQNWAYSFGTQNSTFIFINKDGENAKQNLRDFSLMIDFLPEYLRFESVMDDDGKITRSINNATRMKHPVTGNQILVRGRASGYDDAMSLGRGLSAPILHFDETEFTKWIDVIVKNSVSTFETSSRASKEAGTIYGRIFTSTPGDIDTAAGAAAEKLLAKTAKWSEKFYDMTKEEINEILYANKRIGIVYIEYSYQQIGLTRAWFKKIAADIGDALTVRREILLQRLRGSSLSPYERDDIDRIIDLAKKPIRTIMLQKYYELDIYEELERGLPYIIAVDCATGSLGDNNAIEVINPYTTNVAAEFECNYIGEPDMVDILIELLRDYIPRAFYVIEKNHVGSAIIKFLLKTPYGGRVYYDRYKEIAEENMKEIEDKTTLLRAKAKLQTYHGIHTGTKSREIMFTILANRIKNNKENFVGQKVTRDISKLISKGGKVQAADGFHDDSVMAYLIGMYCLFHGNNLHVFGFDPADAYNTMEKHTGLELPPDYDDVDSSTLPDSVKDFLETEKERSKKNPYEDMLRAAILENQRKTAELAKMGLIHSEIYENTVQEIYDTDVEYESDVQEQLDFLDELNGF